MKLTASRPLVPRALVGSALLFLAVTACGGGGGGAADANVAADGALDVQGHTTHDGGDSPDAHHDGAVHPEGSTGLGDGSADSKSLEGAATLDAPSAKDGASHADGGSVHDGSLDGSGDASSSHDAAGLDGGGPAKDASDHDSGSSHADAAHDGGSGFDTCGYCNTPPVAACGATGSLTYYPAAGTCTAGQCTYTSATTACAHGCANGACSGTGWVTMASNTANDLYAVWGSSAKDVWAVGNNGVAIHFDGMSWTVAAPSEANYLVAVTGTGPNDVYASGGYGTYYHFNGLGWSVVPGLSPTGFNEFADGTIDAPAPGAVWVAGFGLPSNPEIYNTYLYPSDGTTLGPAVSSSASIFAGAANVSGMLAIAPNDVWVGSDPITHYDGVSLTPFTGVRAAAFWAAASDRVFAATEDITVDIWNGASWTPSNTGTIGLTNGVSGTSASRVFASVYLASTNHSARIGEVRSYNGLGWTNETLPANTPDLYGVYAAPTGEVFAVGYGGTVIEGP